MPEVVHNLKPSSVSSALISFGTLASGTYIASSTIDLRDGNGNIPVMITVQTRALNANGTPSGNKQLLLFAKWSFDGSIWTSGPESGTTTTEEADLHFVGATPMNDTNDHGKEFTIYPKAPYMKLVGKNDLGVALSTGGEVVRMDFKGASN